MTRKNILLLGATGSIGDSALAVLRQFSDKFRLWGIVAHQNVEKTLAIVKEFQPKYVCLTAEEASVKFKASTSDCLFLEGMQGAIELARHSEVDFVLSGIAGSVGLLPTWSAIQAGKTIGVANKEPLVMAGELMMKEAQRTNAQILPVDSEHCAIHQCLMGSSKGVENLWLTASGGPFRGYDKSQLEKVTVADALKHPTWNMGSKITIDSATLMNKSLEIIEAHWLFGVPCEKIKVVVQPTSIVHSMVEYNDGSTLAQMGVPSMELPIQYALCYPERFKGNVDSPDWLKIGELKFEEPNVNLRKSLDFAYQVGAEGGSMGVVFNAANEIAVAKFLKAEISFLQIYELIGKGLKDFKGAVCRSIEEIIELDSKIRLEFSKWKS